MEHGPDLRPKTGAETIVCVVFGSVSFKSKRHLDERSHVFADVCENRASFEFQCCRTCDPDMEPEWKMLLFHLFYVLFHEVGGKGHQTSIENV